MRNKCLQKLCACVCFCCLLTWETLKVLLCNTLIQLTRNCSASRSKTRVHTLPPLTQESLHKSMCQDILSSEPKLGMQCSGFPQSFCPSKILVLRSLYCNAKLACGQIQWPETMTCVTLAFQLCGFIGCVFFRAAWARLDQAENEEICWDRWSHTLRMDLRPRVDTHDASGRNQPSCSCKPLLQPSVLQETDGNRPSDRESHTFFKSLQIMS